MWQQPPYAKHFDLLRRSGKMAERSKALESGGSELVLGGNVITHSPPVSISSPAMGASSNLALVKSFLYYGLLNAQATHVD